MIIKAPTVYPTVTTYPRFANMLSLCEVLLETDKHDAFMNWYINQFINITTIRRKDNLIDVFYYDVTYEKNNFLLIKEYLASDIINSYQVFSECVKKYLSDGYAVNILLNQRFFPQRNTNDYYEHYTFIHGYDTVKDLFYISDFFSKYETVTVSTQTLNDSFNTMNYDLFERDIDNPRYDSKRAAYDVSMLKLNNTNDISYEYQPEILLLLIESWSRCDLVGDMQYGRKCFDYIIDGVLNSYIHQNFHILYDRSVALQLSVDYLTKTNKIEYNENLIKNIQMIKSKTFSARNLLLKIHYDDNELNKKNYIETIQKLYRDVHELDEDAVNCLYKLIMDNK